MAGKNDVASDQNGSGCEKGNGGESCGGVCRPVGVFYHALFSAPDSSASDDDSVYGDWKVESVSSDSGRDSSGLSELAFGHSG